jgi:hypothetical protein
MPIRISLAISLCVGLALGSVGCEDSKSCAYEETELSSDDLTPWGSRVEDDFAALAGPYEGTWRWSVTSDHLEIPASGQHSSAWATVQIDPSTYRRSELVGGGGGGRHRGACAGDSILADGVLTVVDPQGAPIVEIPITATRAAGTSPQYTSTPYFSPITDFIAGIEATPEFDYDEEGISGLLIWGDDGDWLHADFVYVAQRQISPTSGGGLLVDVAEFTQDP